MAVDFSIIIAYLVLMLGVGLYYRRFAGKNLENFFLAGRRVPGWLNGVSYSAALVSADAATGYGGLAVVTGAFVCWWYLSRFGLALFVGAVLFAVFWRRLGLFTSLEFYERRFTGRPAALMRFWIAFRTSFIAMPAWTGITLLAAYKIMEPVAGMGKLETMLWVVPVSLLYVLFSGYKGVVVSNLIQMVIFAGGTLCLALMTVAHFGGPTALAERLVSQYGATGAQMLQTVPPATHDVFPLAAALAWLIGQTIGYGGDAAPMGGAVEGQRILSTRTPREAVTMYVVTAVTMFTFVLLVSIPCIAAPLIWPELRNPGADRELAYGMLMKHMLPAGLLGLAVAAMLAGVMSTVSDNLNFGGQVMLNDLYRRWLAPARTEAHYMLAGRACMVVILGMALLVVYKVHIMFDLAVFMLQLSAAELPANWAQWWWWRFNGKARLAASFGGAGIFCLVVLGPRLLLWLGVPGAAALQVPWWWGTFIVMGLTTALWVTVALLTRPDPPAVLDEFYRRAHPLGSWGPVRRRVLESEPAETASAIAANSGGWGLIGRGFGIAAAGAGSVALLILGLSNLYIGRYTSGAACVAGAVVAWVVFRATLAPYLERIDATAPPAPAEVGTRAEPGSGDVNLSDLPRAGRSTSPDPA